MESKLVAIGNSEGVRLPKALIQQHRLKGVVLEIKSTEEGILIAPKKKAREGWEEQIREAIEKHGPPDVDQDWLDFGNEWDKTEPACQYTVLRFGWPNWTLP